MARIGKLEENQPKWKVETLDLLGHLTSYLPNNVVII